MPNPPPTMPIRLSTPMVELISEIARLNRSTAPAVAERLFRKVLEKELDIAMRREAERLNTKLAVASK